MEWTAEHERMADPGHPEDGLAEASPWYRWGPYLADRAWASVREDYSADGTAWDSFPHDHARSRAYRWNEDGFAGLSDVHQNVCVGLALWNGRDPILKERAFGLGGPEGNHGEDAKDYWWFLDAVPSHAWLKWRYHYPQQEFPYADLVATNRARSKLDPEYELIDTGVFDAGMWIVEVSYAKLEPGDVLMRITVRNHGPETDTVHVLPHLWCRNQWEWGRKIARPRIHTDFHDGEGVLTCDHPDAGRVFFAAAPGPDGTLPEPLFCENTTNYQRLFGTGNPTPYPKDGINDHVVSGADSVNPKHTGTKAAFWYRATLAPGETAEFRLRLREAGAPDALGDIWHGDVFDATMRERESEADEFYAALGPDLEPEQRRIARQAFAGMIWSKQFYPYDVATWLDGDPGQPPPPEGRRHGRNSRWRHLNARDIMSMPDPWEYPWFAAWDLAFHAIVFGHIDPAFAKYQLVLLCREWFQHPNGALPAYEWAFDDVNPPVHAMALLRVFAADGATDRTFLARVFHKLLVNFTWWQNKQDAFENNLYEGGFLGLDNISPFDRSHLPVAGTLEQADASAWMASYCLAMLGTAVILARDDPAYEDITTKFLEHFSDICAAMNTKGLWDPTDGFYYDELITPDGTRVPLRVHSLVGVLPIMSAAVLRWDTFNASASLRKKTARFFRRTERGEAEHLVQAGHLVTDETGSVLLSVVGRDQLRRILTVLLDENEFLSPFGLRALSKVHEQTPFTVTVEGVTAEVDYEPGESTTGLFGGNSNWRGPIWFPVNHLVIGALERYHSFYGDDFRVECPTGSGHLMNLAEVAAELRRRLVSLWLPGADGRRPFWGDDPRLADDPEWRDNLFFNEYFHGDTGKGLGALHQTGWTGLVADFLHWPWVDGVLRPGPTGAPPGHANWTVEPHVTNTWAAPRRAVAPPTSDQETGPNL